VLDELAALGFRHLAHARLQLGVVGHVGLVESVLPQRLVSALKAATVVAATVPVCPATHQRTARASRP
jgi:hypothetical protein